MKKPKFFRTPKHGEQIEYNCGCVYEVFHTHGTRTWSIVNEILCVEHDPTLTEYAREHEEEIAEAAA